MERSHLGHFCKIAGAVNQQLISKSAINEQISNQLANQQLISKSAIN
jgi:hypothetical protein